MEVQILVASFGSAAKISVTLTGTPALELQTVVNSCFLETQ